MSIKNNTAVLQDLLNAVNALPPSAGAELPELTNPGTAADLLLNKQFIDGNGAKVTGTFTIDEELSTQDNLIAQIATALEGKSAGGEQATPEISVNSNGLITATAGTKSSTYQMAFQAAKTITPSTVSQIAVLSGYYTGGDVTVAGDSNLVAGNIKSGVSIFGINGTLEEGSIEGIEVEYSENEDAIIGGTISNYTNDRITTIRSEAFAYCSYLTTVSFPICENIGYRAFANCPDLTSISFPVCTRIGNGAFLACTSLTSISFPVCSIINPSAFSSCTSLTSAYFPACERILENAFYNCHNLVTVSLPVCRYINSYVFYMCSALTTVFFPACVTVSNCAFQNCIALTSASFPACTMIYGNAFRQCYTLFSLTLGTSSVCTLSNSNAFSLTPFAGYSSYFSGTPHIYVPSSLITAYQSATNWTYFSSYFSAIESLEE